MHIAAEEKNVPFVTARGVGWERALCGVLLAATLLNYATRQALPAAAVRVQADLRLSNEQYGEVLAVFGLAFAFGAVLFGIVADWLSVRWLYPLVLVVWSALGVAAGFSRDMAALWWLHLAMGLFQPGHWPCAMRTTQRVFPPERRTLANSLLQIGAPLGAVAVCLLMLALVSSEPGSWRPMFWLIGLGGVPWAMVWLATVKSADLRRPALQTVETGEGQAAFEELPLWDVFLSRRFALLVLSVVCINVCWHYLRAWLPVVLEKDLGYTPRAVQGVMIGYWLATLVGGLGAGWLVTRLSQRGWPVQRARMTVFLGLALITSLMAVAAWLPPGWPFVGLVMLIGCGSLGQFPIYYSLNQELSAKHQGKVGGSLGFIAWLPLYFVHPLVGRLMDTNPQARPYVFATVGALPLVAWAVLALGWGRRPVAVAKSFRRRWLQVSLRTLLGIMLLCSVGMGLIVSPALGQRRAIERVRARGGNVTFESSTDGRVRQWLREQLGQDLVDRVVGVDLKGSNVTDADLAFLPNLRHTRLLLLSHTNVGDQGLAHVGRMKGLLWLYVNGTQVSDAGLAHLAGLHRLEDLQLGGAQIAGPGLEHLKGLTGLEELYLHDTQVRDFDLRHLHGLTGLKIVELRGTRVTEAGISQLQEVLPQLHIYH